MNIHMQVNSPELRKQHEEHKARAARLGDRPKRIMRPEAPFRQDSPRCNYSAHVSVWKRVMRRPIDIDVLRLDERVHPDARSWEVVGSVRQIINVVSEYYRIPQREIMSNRRTAPVVRARQIGMYLAKTHTLRSLPEIGRVLGGKDHTTILHGVRKITQRMADDAELAKEIAELTELLSKRKS